MKTRDDYIAEYGADNPVLKENRNGVDHVLSAEERDAVLARWADAAVESDAGKEGRRIAAIKAESGRIITSRFPSWKQHNMNREYAKLQGKWLILPLTEDRARMDRLEADFAWMEAVSAESDRLEADPNATPNWPEYE